MFEVTVLSFEKQYGKAWYSCELFLENIVVEKMIKGDKVLFGFQYQYMVLEQKIVNFGLYLDNHDLR